MSMYVCMYREASINKQKSVKSADFPQNIVLIKCLQITHQLLITLVTVINQAIMNYYSTMLVKVNSKERNDLNSLHLSNTVGWTSVQQPEGQQLGRNGKGRVS